MRQQIIVAGCGFAGMWACISAARTAALAGREDDIEVTMVAPASKLTIRPRLYEAGLDDGVSPDISALLRAVGVRFLAGRVESLDAAGRTVTVVTADGERQVRSYDRLVLATGSRVFLPDVPGLADHAFNVDTLEEALVLEAHLAALGDQPESTARNTVVVGGGGFTGIEVAAEMPGRLRAALGQDAAIRVVIVDPAPEIGIEMGGDTLPYIREALDVGGIEQRPGQCVTAVDADGVTLSGGERIPARTVVWAAGLRAQELAAQVPGEHDALGRVIGDAWLRAPEADGIFVTGDIVRAATDEAGNCSLMTCQHAVILGRVAGHNAAADLLGRPLHPYSQPRYGTCLDLGEWGALYTEGWDRQVRLTTAEGKAMKKNINTVWIYPPAADREAAFAVAHPDYVVGS